MDSCRGVLLGILLISACGDSPPGRTYYERNIEPILTQKCAGNTSGCHSINPGDAYAFAAGNLDVTSFENIQKRRDTLTPFGPYQYPLLLIKAVAPAMPDPTDPNKLSVQYRDEFKPLDVLHAGGAIIEVSSDAYFTLQTWLENGATENGLKPPTPAREGAGACQEAVPPGFDASTYTADPNFASFRDTVQPVLADKGCAAQNCHGAPQSDFYITCGNDDTQLAFNMSQTWSFVNNPVDDSQLLRVPLAVAAGGRGHTGGDQFGSTTDAQYQALRAWAMTVGKIEFGDTPEKAFFADHVQPIFLQRGCAFEACHSPQAANDFKLRAGTQGFFSAVALEKNYELIKKDFMAVELADARRGRAVAKAILESDYRVPGQVGGIAHRGGSVLETPGSTNGSDPAMCPSWGGSDTPPPGVTPFCVMQEWINRERAALGGAVSPMNSGSTIDVVFVDRPAGQAADRLQFATFQGGADLVSATATFGADYGQQLSVTGAPQSLLGSCSGLTAGTADVQAPDVANDGDRVAFAARNSAGEPLSIYVVSLSTGACTQVTPASGMIHNFDPAWAPDGQHLVFASTRGKAGPTESRKRPLPQSDLWRVELDATNAPIGMPQQMTFLSNSEIGPPFIREGRMIMTTEKAASDGGGFYQLSGRRLNWDLTDYHPLLAQRSTSPYATLTDLVTNGPSVGYGAATDIREGGDGNYVLILSDVDATGAPVVPGGGGALAIFNRSVGPMEQGRTDPGYLPSMEVLDEGAASGRAGAASAYRSPFYLPDGQIMASFAATASLGWTLVAVNPRTQARQTLLAPAGGRAYVDAVLAIKYPVRPFYNNRRQLVFGGTAAGDPAHAIVHFPDAPMAFTLLTGNLRRGRPVDAFRSARYVVVEQENPCPAGSCPRTNGLYESRTMLGRAELASDGSARIRVPSGTGVVLSLADENGNTIIKMSEEHQLGPGELISMGIRESFTNAAGQEVRLFDAVCGGCHGSVTGREVDVLVTPDALTGASSSLSQTADPQVIGP